MAETDKSITKAVAIENFYESMQRIINLRSPQMQVIRESLNPVLNDQKISFLDINQLIAQLNRLIPDNLVQKRAPKQVPIIIISIMNEFLQKITSNSQYVPVRRRLK